MRFKIKKTGSFKFSKKYLDLISNSKVYDVAINTPITFALISLLISLPK